MGGYWQLHVITGKSLLHCWWKHHFMSEKEWGENEGKWTRQAKIGKGGGGRWSIIPGNRQSRQSCTLTCFSSGLTEGTHVLKRWVLSTGDCNSLWELAYRQRDKQVKTTTDKCRRTTHTSTEVEAKTDLYRRTKTASRGKQDTQSINWQRLTDAFTNLHKTTDGERVQNHLLLKRRGGVC